MGTDEQQKKASLQKHPASDDIIYLAQRKFPDFKTVMRRAPPGSDGPPLPAAAKLRQEEIKAFLADLKRRSPSEIAQLAAHERAQERAERTEHRERVERSRSFNKPGARANFDHWSKAAYWTLEEGVALALGRNPDKVTWSSVEAYVDYSPFAKQFAELRELALRAERAGVLGKDVTPTDFLAWARRMGVDVPQPLKDRVVEIGEQVQDWRHRFDLLQLKYDEDIGQLRAQLAQADSERAHLQGQLEACRSELHAERANASALDEMVWDGFDPESGTYPYELDVAMQVWRAATNAKMLSGTPRQHIEAWLSKNCPNLTREQQVRIATVANWQKGGGRPRQDKN